MRRPGAERTDVEPAWPTRLLPSPTRLIYLDLNQWIAVAKSASGHPDGYRFQPALDLMRSNREGWTYVISMPLIMELTGNLRRSQRAALGNVIEEFTDFACVMPLTTVAALEFETALSKFMPIRERFMPVPILGQGVLQACGMRGGMQVRDAQGEDVTARARREAPVGPKEFDRRLAQAELDLNRALIRGPASDNEEQALRGDGWDPSVARQVAERRARQEREQAARLAEEPRWRRGRLRDLVTARYLALEIENIRDEALAAHGVRLSDVFTDVESARRFSDSMPAGDVWITLVTAKHRNPDSVWKPNDIFDIDALSVAVAYCDVVVTERHSVHVLAQADAPKRFGTELFTSISQLADHLDS